MQPTMEILEKINQNSSKNKDEVFTRLFRYMLRSDIYFVAYKNLYANNGAATKGINDDTADGFSENKVTAIIANLENGSYTPKPSRRTYIQKANGKLRPLGIPTFTDKLVQEVLRMILEAVYEPVFSEYSHGFRPNKSCHTALQNLRRQFNGVRWFIEGDIKGCFDNIDHNALIKIINAKIKDARLIQLIYKFLKAGYMEDWRYNQTYSGTPQGGIVSPILANIYLNELDKFVIKLKADFDKPNPQNLYTLEYNRQRIKVDHIRLKLKRDCNKDKIPQLLVELKKERGILLQLPSKSQTDKILRYVRYADDFIIGINGNRIDCERIKAKLKTFIDENLKMELSEEKTLITHSSDYARFLGYDIRIRRSGVIKDGGAGFTKRTLSNSLELNIPLKDKIEKFLWKIKAVRIKNGALFPIARTQLLRLSELEILSSFNAELRGICNFYGLASNYPSLNYFAYLMEYSCLKTIAAKHNISIQKVLEKYNDRKKGWCIPYVTKSGKKQLYFAKWKNCRESSIVSDTQCNQTVIHLCSTSSFEARLKAKVCELCGNENAKCYEIHHVNKLKNLKGKEIWERIMIAKNRKTMVLCHECHKKLHGKKEENLKD